MPVITCAEELSCPCVPLLRRVCVASAEVAWTGISTSYCMPLLRHKRLHLAAVAHEPHKGVGGRLFPVVCISVGF